MNLNNQKHYSINQKITNLALLFAVFLGTLIYFAIMPSVAEIKNLENQIINEKINNEKKYQTENNIIVLNKKINELEVGIRSLDEVFINKNREIEFITVLENIANKNNVIQKITLTSPTENQQAKTAKKSKATDKESSSSDSSSPLMITLTGNYKNIVNYLVEINSLSYYVNIEGLNFSRELSANSPLNDNSNRGQIITLNMTAKTYWK